MAQVILSGIGAALGGPIGGALGKLAGSLVDRAAIDALSPARIVGATSSDCSSTPPPRARPWPAPSAAPACRAR